MARSLKHPLRHVGIETNALAEDAVSAVIEHLTGVTPGIHTDVQSGRVTVSAYMPLADTRTRPLKSELAEALTALRSHDIDPAPGIIRIRKVPARDWSESWKRHFKPIEIGSRLLVKPTWNRRRPRSGQAVLVLDPGLSFGTGQHATTRFCLSEIVRFRSKSPNQSLLDAGCGSGILALAAAAIGYSPVEAFDFDPDCVRISHENAALNQLEGRVQFEQADVTRLPKRPTRRFDVVCANLMHDLLIAEAPRLVARIAPGGRLVLAGILATQFPAVEAAYRELGWKLDNAVTEGEWRSGSFISA